MNLNNGSCVSFKSGESFGSNIGLSHKEGQSFSDDIKEVNTNLIVAVTTLPHARKSFYLNITQGILDKIVYEELNTDGSIKASEVYRDPVHAPQ